ncbi:MAG TPA: flagellar basal body-associated FliL family protein [Polyangiaceae bacterium]|nr:flagellar basal body-associated FliL family protein [Polyangiaceae bacterium]
MENEDESQQAEGEDEPKKPAKSSARLFLIIGAVIATGGSAAAGAVLGPSLAGKGHAQTAAAPAAASSEHGEEGGELAALDPIIVDIREANGDAHHLKVGIAVELGKGVTDEEFKRQVPRIRDSAISYLRSLKFDEITSPAKFDPIRTELGERIAHASGKAKVQRVLFTDFVAQ